MASTELENQPTQEPFQNEENNGPLEGSVPTHKSGVITSNDPLDIPNKYEKGDSVHFTDKRPGLMQRLVLTVRRARFDPNGGYWEYQLVDSSGQPYDNGAWKRERDMKLNKKRGR